MTVNELVEKLEQVRNFIEGSDDDNVRQAFDESTPDDAKANRYEFKI